jgi:succinylarginine dihydrolase
MQNMKTESNPRAAALQGLEKMWNFVELGMPQGFFPPQERPHLPTLLKLGYRGVDAEIIRKIQPINPEIFYIISSASSMWAANAATVTPSTDSGNETVNFTAANLVTKFHRTIETPMTEKLLKLIFNDPRFFTHHSPLPIHTNFSDEGAANHNRFCNNHSERGVHLFVYGRTALKPNIFLPTKYPARQTFEASQSIARLHGLSKDSTVFVQQNPKVIDAGVFHNDVISVGNQNVLLFHELAFIESDFALEEIQTKVMKTCMTNMVLIKVKESQVPLTDAISSYLFNSQLVTLPDKSMALFAPLECKTTPSVFNYLEEMVKDPANPILKVSYIDIRESMRNGGGPACLRLRVILNEKEYAAVNPNFLLTEKLYIKLKDWINKHYRESLHLHDLFDPKLHAESCNALDELAQMLNMGAIYEFQTGPQT